MQAELSGPDVRIPGRAFQPALATSFFIFLVTAAALTSGQNLRRKPRSLSSAVHVVEHPDAAVSIFHCKDELVTNQ